MKKGDTDFLNGGSWAGTEQWGSDWHVFLEHVFVGVCVCECVVRGTVRYGMVWLLIQVQVLCRSRYNTVSLGVDALLRHDHLFHIILLIINSSTGTTLMNECQ